MNIKLSAPKKVAKTATPTAKKKNIMSNDVLLSFFSLLDVQSWPPA
jgi:hypothetical protein